MLTKNSFAIRVKDLRPTLNKGRFYALVATAAKNLPNFKVEGINKSYKKPAIEKEVLARIETDEFELEFGKTKKVARNLIGVGVSKRADVSFEKESDIKLNAFVSLVPIFDLETQFGLIVDRFKDYLLAAYGWKFFEEVGKKAKAKKVKVVNAVRKHVAVVGIEPAPPADLMRHVVIHAH